MHSQKLTIVIPTYNRPRQLDRLLFLLSRYPSEHKTLILDGSEKQGVLQNRSVVNNYINVDYTSYDPNYHLGLRLYEGLKRVETDYVMICGDDDICLPNSFDMAVRFLDTNLDYSAVIGWPKTISYVESGWKKGGFVLGNQLDHGRDLDHPEFVSRFIEYFAYTAIGSIPLYYSFRRTTEIVDTFSHITPEMKWTSMELLSVLLVLWAGRIKILPIVSSIRDYNVESVRAPMREDPVHYFAEQDLSHIRGVLYKKMILDGTKCASIINYILDLKLDLAVSVKHTRERPPENVTTSNVTEWLWNFQCFCSIYKPEWAADFNRIDRKMYSVIRTAQRRSQALPET